ACASSTRSCSATSRRDGRTRMTAKEAGSYACSTARTISCGPGSWASNGPPTRSCRPLSIASSSCRIAWHPSRRLCLALATLGLLGAGCVLVSDLPVAAQVPLAPAALAYGLWLARREAQRPPCELELDGEGGVLVRRGAFEQALSSP